jgi:hypothetical protein
VLPFVEAQQRFLEVVAGFLGETVEERRQATETARLKAGLEERRGRSTCRGHRSG